MLLTGLLQTLGFIEVLHGALGGYIQEDNTTPQTLIYLKFMFFIFFFFCIQGIVPSGFLFPLMQWGGRTHFVIAIVHRLLEVYNSPIYHEL